MTKSRTQQTINKTGVELLEHALGIFCLGDRVTGGKFSAFGIAQQQKAEKDFSQALRPRPQTCH
jgi:hypothetical protein